jgi:hypothetical protein
MDAGELLRRSTGFVTERPSRIALHNPRVLLVGACPQLSQPRVFRGDRIPVFPNRAPDPVGEPQTGDDRDEQPKILDPQRGDDQHHQELHAPSLRPAADTARITPLVLHVFGEPVELVEQKPLLAVLPVMRVVAARQPHVQQRAHDVGRVHDHRRTGRTADRLRGAFRADVGVDSEHVVAPPVAAKICVRQ